jgi:hypothetical protein
MGRAAPARRDLCVGCSPSTCCDRRGSCCDRRGARVLHRRRPARALMRKLLREQSLSLSSSACSCSRSSAKADPRRRPCRPRPPPHAMSRECPLPLGRSRGCSTAGQVAASLAATVDAAHARRRAVCRLRATPEIAPDHAVRSMRAILASAARRAPAFGERIGAARAQPSARPWRDRAFAARVPSKAPRRYLSAVLT